MGLLEWLSGRLASLRSSKAEPLRPKPATRRAVVEWLDVSGEASSQRALLQSDADGKPWALVRQALPGSTARIRERSSYYLVRILSTAPVSNGFELELEYLSEGRRREQRTPVQGQALLEGDGHKAISVDIVNVSAGGMQVVAPQPIAAGVGVRVTGTETDYVGVVRYCRDAPSGYFLGIQLFGGNRR